MGTGGTAQNSRNDTFRNSVKVQHQRLPDQTAVHFRAGLDGLRIFRLFFRVAALLNDFAQSARVVAVESFVHGLGQRSFGGIPGQHADPSYRLQKSPVQAQREDQHEHRGKSEKRTHASRTYPVGRTRQDGRSAFGSAAIIGLSCDGAGGRRGRPSRLWRTRHPALPLPAQASHASARQLRPVRP